MQKLQMLYTFLHLACTPGGNKCYKSKMNFASLFQLTLHPKGVSANGVENPPGIGSHSWVGQTTTKVDFFAELVVKHSCAPLRVLLAAK
jgi:hypothetical protein